METLKPASKIRFSCGACSAVFEVAPGLAGRRGICKRCKGPLVVPARAAESPAAPAAPPPAVSPAAETGSRFRTPRRLAWVFALMAAVGAVFLFSDYFKSGQVNTTVARLIALNEATIANLLPEAAAGWEPAAEQTVRLVAELEGLDSPEASTTRKVLLVFFRRQEAFLRAKARLDQMSESVKASVGFYRRHMWHPPAEPQQWPQYLEQTEALRRALQQQLNAFQDASAAAAELHSELLGAEKAAAAQLAAEGLGMATFFGDRAVRMQGVLAEIGDQASGSPLEPL